MGQSCRKGEEEEIREVRLFVDANVLFSAAWSQTGAPYQLIRKAAPLDVEVCSSPYAMNEARQNLETKAPQKLTKLKELASCLNLLADKRDLDKAIVLRLKDRPIVATAAGHHCRWLVTGDRRDFSTWLDKDEPLMGMLVLSPHEALQRLIQSVT